MGQFWIATNCNKLQQAEASLFAHCSRGPRQSAGRRVSDVNQPPAMLNRTLFDDMLAAHWAVKHRERAVERMSQHDQYSAVLRAEALEQHGLPRYTKVREYTEEERKRLDVRYRNGARSWTGRSLPQMLRVVEEMWPVECPRFRGHPSAWSAQSDQAGRMSAHAKGIELPQAVPAGVPARSC